MTAPLSVVRRHLVWIRERTSYTSRWPMSTEARLVFFDIYSLECHTYARLNGHNNGDYSYLITRTRRARSAPRLFKNCDEGTPLWARAKRHVYQLDSMTKSCAVHVLFCVCVGVLLACFDSKFEAAADFVSNVFQINSEFEVFVRRTCFRT